ncbi:MAG: helix-turn-helix transcriptional regulator [Anaerolineales bacterium]|nr:helix-turn-helix transcriptional regulator [Anaerolineales bacterium]
MPGGRRGDPGPCRKRRRRGMRLILRPSLLLMLAEKENHGYELYDQLSAFGFEPQQLDSSIVYRDLREMEELGLIESYWDDDSKGPKRRMYRILDAGQTRLKEWIESLKSIKNRINQLIKRYKSN